MGNAYSRLLVNLSLILTVLGLIMLTSASAVLGEQQYGDVFYFVKRQIIQGVLLGSILAIILARVPLDLIKKFSFVLFFLNVIITLLCFIPPFKVSGSALRWVKIGPISFQPSEFLKITYPLFLATFLEKFSLSQRKKIFAKPFLTFLFSLGLIALIIIKQPSTGTIVIIAFASSLMYFIAGLSGKQILVLALIICLGGFYIVKTTPYRLTRVLSFFQGENTQGENYHITQALIGIGSGGWFGLGLGNSVQKFNYLPESHTDAIFPIIAEELGFIGATIVVILFILLISIGFKITQKNQQEFSKFLAGGLTAYLVIQIFINLGGMLHLIPIAGVPLPFFSYGSSSLVTTLATVGLLCNLAKNI
ncbi:MAG: cell division protein FtsW [Candidatus Pacebacteria bacterium]|nr:cell division protein FtsW [Candidatus Paceibacterota bacterium]MDD3434626.1 putative peptidoglycan glycosyltransferase FtsW [Candidatus Paceibacterota bacterium]